MLTESEAAKKWCPFARVLVERGIESFGSDMSVAVAAVNRGGKEANAATCCSFGCAVWRGVGEVYRGEKYTPPINGGDASIVAFGERMKAEGRHPDKASRVHLGVHQYWYDSAERGGYCGLAGKPE